MIFEALGALIRAGRRKIMGGKTLMTTLTGEPFQPVRLHYKVFDPKGLARAIEKLRCVDTDPTQSRRVWLYEHEARTLRFKQSYSQIPKQFRPVIIGSFFARGEDALVLDLRSPERAVAAIPFFDKHIPRTVAKVTDAEVVNSLFSTEDPTLTPDRIFDRQASADTDPEATMRKLRDLAAGKQDPAERLRAVMAEMESGAKQALPMVERIPVHFYEDGIQGLEYALKLRQIVAMKHWLGKTSYTLGDAINESLGLK
jgi:hypothetical protein